MKKGQELDNILEECLERILAGDETVEQCLASHPEQSVELEPLLQTAMIAKEAIAIYPRADFRERARYQFQAAVREIELKKERRFWGWQPQWAMVLVTVLVILLAGGSGTVVAAQGSMPDEPLYRVKLTTEAARIALTPSDLGKAELYVRYADKRVAEIEKMVAEGKQEQVERAADLLNSELVAVANLVAPPVEEAAVLMAPAAPTIQEAPPPAQNGLQQAPPLREEPAPPAREESPVAGKRAGPQVMEAPESSGDGGNVGVEQGIKPDKWGKLQETLERRAADNPEALRKLLADAPESAKPALRRAIEKADEGYQQALEALEKSKKQ